MHFYILNRAAQVRAKDGPFGRRKSGGQKFSSRVLKPWDALGKLGQHRIAAHGNPLHYVLQDVQVDRAQAAEAAEDCAVKEHEEQEEQEEQEEHEKELTQELS